MGERWKKRTVRLKPDTTYYGFACGDLDAVVGQTPIFNAVRFGYILPLVPALASLVKRIRWRVDGWRARRLLGNPALYDAVAYKGARTSEPFELHSGLRLHYGPLDDPAYLLLELFVHDTYRLRRWYRPKAGDIICDIGGNIGWFALACCHHASGAVHIHSFEPDPDSCNRFRHNIDANALAAQLTIEQFAIANSVRTSRLSRTHPLRRQLGQHGVAVSCLTLEEALARAGKPIDLLKIDVEGGETDILTDPAMLTDVRRVALEWHSTHALTTCEQTLRRAGFSSLQVHQGGHVAGHEIGMLWASRK